jgi:hypothetical protein
MATTATGYDLDYPRLAVGKAYQDAELQHSGRGKSEVDRTD